MTTISTHILDTSLGLPAAGVPVLLTTGGRNVGQGITNADGRVSTFTSSPLEAGRYQLTFDVAGYFAETQRSSFYQTVVIDFVVEAGQHYHVPLLLSPFGYSTYRGS